MNATYVAAYWINCINLKLGEDSFFKGGEGRDFLERERLHFFQLVLKKIIDELMTPRYNKSNFLLQVYAQPNY